MRVLCAASGEVGHMDFGGGGFVALARSLAERGAALKWLSFGEQVARLKKAGFDAERSAGLQQLALRPFSPADASAPPSGARLAGLQSALDDCRAWAPDVVLFDRLLAFGGLIAAELQRPFVTIGAPGGPWRFEEITKPQKGVNVRPETAPIETYQAYGERVRHALSWRDSDHAVSGWLCSPYLNVHFLPHDFYGDVTAETCASVYHREPKDTASTVERASLGVSFGNQGGADALKRFLEIVIDKALAPTPIQVFAGRRDDIAKALRAAYSSDQATVHGWVDFGEHFPRLHTLAFLGGVGAIWRCIEQRVAMLVVPGLIGDQLYNGKRIEALGLGACLSPETLTDQSVASALETCARAATVQSRLHEVAEADRYTDTLISVCARIEALAHR
ncbi:MAG: hypothetical protein AAGA09_08735 [Pseudomonadota bacterium]